MLIGIVGWIILGMIAGFIASKLVKLRGDDPRLGVLLGGAGGLIGGWLYSLFTGNAVTPFNLMSLFIAAVASIAALVSWHTWRRNSAH
jgi:uncharacterized membrane protein YeaQ/YmgE (transglycosylase-associated protein family)